MSDFGDGYDWAVVTLFILEEGRERNLEDVVFAMLDYVNTHPAEETKPLRDAICAAWFKDRE